MNLSKSFIMVVARLGDFLKLPLNTERLKKLTESYVVSKTKITAALGQLLPVSSKEGLLRTFLSFIPMFNRLFTLIVLVISFPTFLIVLLLYF